MSNEFSYFCSTIGRKQVVGVTGLGLSFFVLTHMAGNLLMFISPKAYNMYGHAITSNPAYYLIEAALLGLFLAHLVLALGLSLKNKMARQDGYAMNASGDKATPMVTRTMWHQGIVILIFTILHLITFRFGVHYEIDYDGVVVRDLFKLISEVFQNEAYVAGYIIALIVLGFHLSHGVASAFQTLGIHHPRHTCLIKKISCLYAVVVAAGFISQPVYIFFFYKG